MVVDIVFANGGELDNSFDQAERFKAQLQAKEHALPPAVGVGLGIVRFVMLLTNTMSIKDVILFSTLKKK